MSKFNYHIITRLDDDPTLCAIKHEPDSIIKSWRLNEGVPMGSDFPSDAEFQMDKREGNMVSDFLYNVLSLLMISPKVRQLMEQENISDVEFLPFVLLDKKGKMVSTEYCVANLLGGVDCVDQVNSVYKPSAFDPGEIGNLYKLNLLVDKIPEEKKLFRLKQRPTTYIVRSDFLKVLRDNKVSGLATLDLNTDIIL